MRLFVAVDFPDSLKKYLSEVGTSLKNDAADVAVAREHHLTLKFLGEQSENYAAELERRLSRVSFKPFEARLTKIGTFGDGKTVRVVWGGIEPVAPFAALAKEIDKATPEVKDTYPEYTPHITFARVKHIIAKEAFNELLKRTKLEEKSFAVREFKLYRSVAGQEGHRYQVLATFPAKA